MSTCNLRQWGNGKGIRLPKTVLESLHVQLGDELSITTDGSSVILTPVSKPPRRKTLDELLDNVTPEDVGGEWEWGEEVGAEAHAP